MVSHKTIESSLFLCGRFRRCRKSSVWDISLMISWIADAGLLDDELVTVQLVVGNRGAVAVRFNQSWVPPAPSGPN